jgi:hypothetical protein
MPEKHGPNVPCEGPPTNAATNRLKLRLSGLWNQPDATGLRSVVKATLLPVTASSSGVSIKEDLYKPHASRQCKPPKGEGNACMCAGGSFDLSWLAQYTYEVSGLSAGIALGLVYVRVIHGALHYKVNGTDKAKRGRKKTHSWSVTEYWRVGRGGKTLPDCIGYTHPFDQYWCGIESVVHTEAQIVFSDSPGIPDVSWSEYAAYSYDAAGAPHAVDRSPEGPHTPDGAGFVDASGVGVHATKTIKPEPSHCHNWRSYVNYRSNGMRDLDHKEPAPNGKYYGPGGGLQDEPPKDTKDGKARTWGSSNSSGGLASVLDDSGTVSGASSNRTVLSAGLESIARGEDSARRLQESLHESETSNGE